MNGMITVVMVDDHALVRESLAASLAARGRFHVAGQGCDASEAVALCAALKPDILVMDVDMPGLGAFEAADHVKTVSPNTRLVYLSAFMSDHYIESALKTGARGYVLKSEPSERLAEGLERVAEEDVFFSEPVWQRLVVGDDGIKFGTETPTRLSLLSSRETEVLRLVARGMSKKEIGDMLKLSVKTVEVHTYKLMKKLQIHDRVQLARFAIREGMVQP